MELSIFVKLCTVLACVDLSLGFPFTNMFGRRGLRPRSRLFGTRFPTSSGSGRTVERKKPASRPFTIPGFEHSTRSQNSRSDSLDFNLGALTGRALIDPIAGLYDPPAAGGGGGGISFVNGVNSYGIDLQGTGLSDVGGGMYTNANPLQDQYFNDIGASGRNLGFIDQNSGHFLSAANSRNLGVLDMNRGLQQPLNVGTFGNDLSGGNTQLSVGSRDLSFNGRSLDANLQNSQFGNGGRNSLSISNADLGLGGNQIGNQVSLDAGQLDLELSQLQGQIGLDSGVSIQNSKFSNGGRSSLGLTNADLGLGGNQIGNQVSLNGGQLGKGLSGLQSQIGVDTNQISGNGGQLGMSGRGDLLGGGQMGLGGNDRRMTNNQMGGGQMGGGGSQLGVGGRRMNLGMGQLDMGGGQVGMGGGQLDMAGNQMDMGGSQNMLDVGGLTMPSKQRDSGSGGTLSRQSGGAERFDFGPGQMGVVTGQVLDGDKYLSAGQLSSGLSQLDVNSGYQDSGLGVMPTQVSLTNSQFMSPTEQSQDQLTSGVNMPNSQLRDPTSGMSSGNTQLNPTSGMSLSTQLNARALDSEFNSPLMASQLSQTRV